MALGGHYISFHFWLPNIYCISNGISRFAFPKLHRQIRNESATVNPSKTPSHSEYHTIAFRIENHKKNSLSLFLNHQTMQYSLSSTMESYHHRITQQYHFSSTSMDISQRDDDDDDDDRIHEDHQPVLLAPSRSSKYNSSEKSRPIPIDPSKSREYEDNIRSTEYDMATQRMYQRIINHHWSSYRGLMGNTTSNMDPLSNGEKFLGMMEGCDYSNSLPPFVRMEKETDTNRSSEAFMQDLDHVISEIEDGGGIFQFDL